MLIFSIYVLTYFIKLKIYKLLFYKVKNIYTKLDMLKI